MAISNKQCHFYSPYLSRRINNNNRYFSKKTKLKFEVICHPVLSKKFSVRNTIRFSSGTRSLTTRGEVAYTIGSTSTISELELFERDRIWYSFFIYNIKESVLVFCIFKKTNNLIFTILKFQILTKNLIKRKITKFLPKILL